MLIAMVLGLITVAAVALLLSQSIRIPREPDREGRQDAEASGAYDQISYWPIYAFERYLMVRALGSRRRGGTLLDVGCGPAHLTAALAARFPAVASVGLDVNEHMLGIARRRFHDIPGLELVQGDAERLPFAASSVDTIISSLSLHHWRRAGMALEEIARVLKPGGSVVLFDLRRDCPRWAYGIFLVGQALFLPVAIRKTNGAVGSIWASYTAAELAVMLSEAGFGEAVIESRFGWLLVRAGKLPS
jgi:ubiquinone/menaquinone biosynthesis C-methylase UbiE